MSVFTTAGCRVRQAFFRLEKRSRRPVVQTAEESAGAIFSVAQILRSNRLKRPLVVIGADAAQWQERLLRVLEENDISYALWEGLPAVPTVNDGENISLAWFSRSCDCFIAMGDDRALDVVKAAAARAARRGKTIMNLIGSGKVRKKLPPVLAIPTTAGSGAVSLSQATVADGHGNDFLMDDPALTPPLAVLDPELLENMSREILSAAAIDGVCLAVEAYLSGYGDVSARAMAAEALRGFFGAVEPCWNSGGTPEERGVLLSASRRAGEAASRAGAGYARALSRAAVRVADTDFSEACAAVLPAVLEKYGNHVLERLSVLADETGVSQGGTKQEKASALIGRLRQLAFRIDLPEAMSAVPPDAIAEIADLAAAEANPRYACPVVWTAEDCSAVLRTVCAVRELS